MSVIYKLITMYETTIKENQSLNWKKTVSQLTSQFTNEVFRRRDVKSELKPKVTAEILIYLDMLIVSKLNESFPVSTTVTVAKNNLKEITAGIDNQSTNYNDIIRLSSIRQNFYKKALLVSSEDEDFLRTIGMQWFQFPFQEVDGAVRPSEFDFSYYFSDNVVVSEILFELAPEYTDKIIDELKEQCDMAY